MCCSNWPRLRPVAGLWWLWLWLWPWPWRVTVSVAMAVAMGLLLYHCCCATLRATSFSVLCRAAQWVLHDFADCIFAD